jgi:hypothetical protein
LQNIPQGLMTDISQREPSLRIQAAGHDRSVSQNCQMVAQSKAKSRHSPVLFVKTGPLEPDCTVDKNVVRKLYSVKDLRLVREPILTTEFSADPLKNAVIV